MTPMAVSDSVQDLVIVLINMVFYPSMFIFVFPAIQNFAWPPVEWFARLKSWALTHRVAVAWRVALVVGLVPAVIEGFFPTVVQHVARSSSPSCSSSSSRSWRRDP